MSGKSAIVPVLVLLVAPLPADGAAWTMPEGQAQVISGVFASRASAQFDDRGRASEAIDFTKIYTQVYAEYGWTDSLTFLAAPEFESARWRVPGGPENAKRNVAIASGIRYRLFSSFGTASVEANLKSGGTFDAAISSGRLVTSRQIELRLLYGTNFKLAGCDGFADVEAGHRWIVGDRANEVPVDVTLGLRLTGRSQILVQSFSVVSTAAEPGSGPYRAHKIALSAIQSLGGHFSIQFGGYYSPLGRNSLKEQGLMASLWARF